ncbi:MAG: endonuclease [Bacteroidota bacterium]
MPGLFRLLSVTLLIVPATSGQTLLPGLTGEALLDAVVGTYAPVAGLSGGQSRDTLYAVVDRETRDGLDGVAGLYTDAFVAFDCTPSCDPSQDVFNGGSGINQEHVWPRSQGTGSGLAERDLHHLFPTRVRVNSDRGSLPFGDSPDAQTDTWYALEMATASAPPTGTRSLWSELLSGSRFEPRESRKGDVARAVFYVYAMYGPRGTDQVDAAFFDGMRDTLVAWHRADPPTAAEVARSERVAAYQTTASGADAINPFVADSSLAARAFLDAPRLTLTALLEGAYNAASGTMRTDLSAVLPEADPVLGAASVPAGYFTADPTGQRVVDWVTVRFRDGAADGPVVAEMAALLLDDGAVVGPDGGTLRTPASGTLHVSLGHRNHVDVTTAASVMLDAGSAAAVDFSAAVGVAAGSGQAPTADGRAALRGGDATADGQVTAPDFNVYASEAAAGATGYTEADFTLDGVVTAPDFNVFAASTAAGS